MIDRNRMVAEFLELSAIDSPSLGERAMADALITHLGAIGLTVAEDDAAGKLGGSAGNLVCRVLGNLDVPAVMLLAHMDTVTPCLGKKPMVDGDMIRSNGSTILGADDVAGIVCILEVLRSLKEDGTAHGPVIVVFTVAEEIGLMGAKQLNLDGLDAAFCLVADCGGAAGRAIVAAPAKAAIHATVRGRAAHAGLEPEKGVSAIEIAAAAIATMKLGRIDEETTANIGSIAGGGATNIVCSAVELKAEARSRDSGKLDRQVAHMRQCLEEAAESFGGTVDFVSTLEYPPLSVDREGAVVRLLGRAAERVGVNLALEVSGGGYDGNIISAAGIPSVPIACGAHNAHRLDEYLSIPEMVQSAEFIARAILEMSAY